jgi:large subunit ribosomal protein L22
MESSAVAKYVRLSPRKVRLIMDEIRGRKVEEAINMLTFTTQKGGKILKKLINSAVSNAQQNSNIDIDKLFVYRIFADEGPTLKRFSPRAQGRATQILKRTCHLTVVLNDSKK